MGEAKLRIRIGDLQFEGEGDVTWLTERLDDLYMRPGRGLAGRASAILPAAPAPAAMLGGPS
jgi:hypothetical protein